VSKRRAAIAALQKYSDTIIQKRPDTRTEIAMLDAILDYLREEVAKDTTAPENARRATQRTT
jgi:uncharacterized protein (UPF0147 family)